MFGAKANKIASEIGTSKQEAQELINMYFNKARGLKKFIDTQRNFVMQNGWIKSALGRTRRVPEVYSPSRGVQAHASNSAFNFLIQSVASDINVLAFKDIMKEMIERDWLHKTWRPFNLVHDSIVAGLVDNKEAIDETINIYATNFQRIVKHIYPFMPVPIGQDFEFGPDWASVEKVAKVSKWLI